MPEPQKESQTVPQNAESHAEAREPVQVRWEGRGESSSPGNFPSGRRGKYLLSVSLTGGLAVLALAAALFCPPCSLPPISAARQVHVAQGAGMLYPQSAEAIAQEAKRLIQLQPRRGERRGTSTDAAAPVSASADEAPGVIQAGPETFAARAAANAPKLPASSASSSDSSASTAPSDDQRVLSSRNGTSAGTSEVQMVLAPHAAWFFSGHIAAAAIRELPRNVKRVFIMAANHNSDVSFDGISVERAHKFRLPGLELKVDQEAVESLLRMPGFFDVPEAHDAFVIEVELPLLRAALEGDFTIVPLIFGNTAPRDAPELAAALNKVMNREGDAALFSLDLSHYRPDAEARALDSQTLSALSEMDAERIAQARTDGTMMLLTVNELAALRGLSPVVLGYANSGEAAEGDPESVVGYGAVIYEKRFDLSDSEKSALTNLARQALAARLRGGKKPVAEDLAARFPRLKTRRSAFVTLRKGQELRGCMGSLMPGKPLAEEILENTAAAAFSDDRFEPVKAEELDELGISIEVVSPPRREDIFGQASWTKEMSEAEKYGGGLRRLHRDHPGILMSRGLRAATYLPSVWNQLPDPVQFLESLCGKLEAQADCWMESRTGFELYETLSFSEGSDGERMVEEEEKGRTAAGGHEDSEAPEAESGAALKAEEKGTGEGESASASDAP